MRNFVICTLLLFIVACSCVTAGDKQSIQFVDGTVKTVYGLTKDGEVISYYKSKEDASSEQNKVTVPLSSVKQITDVKDE